MKKETEMKIKKNSKEGKMRKLLKVAILGAAVGAMGLSGTAMAGEEACFIIKKGAPSIIGADDLLNVSWSTCAGTAGDPANAQPAKIAYELTGNLQLDFGDVTGGVIPLELGVVYVPTTDIPPGTLIELKLNGAKWDEGGTLYLLKAEDPTDANADGNADDPDLISVASTDGATSGTDTLRFITKAGVTIGAGTKLVLSSSEDSDLTNTTPEYTLPKILIQNSGCPTSSKVTLEVSRAVTDGGTGYAIQGAVTKTSFELVDTSPQYEVFVNPVDATYAEVDVESDRKNFVEDIKNGDVDKVQTDKVIYAVTVKDKGLTGNLDRYITEGATDHLKLSFEKSDGSDFPNFMDIVLYDSYTDGGNTADTFNNILADVTGTNVFRADGTEYSFALDTIMTDDAANDNTDGGDATVDTNRFYVSVQTDGTDIMPYNYNIDTKAWIDFNNPDYIDHCEISRETHKISINGAVIKVPYFSTSTSWLQYIKIVNEDVAPADVYVDLMAKGVEKKNIHVGTVPAKGEVWIWGSTIKSLGEANGITPDDQGSYEAVFTVTAPKNKVHATSIQKTPYGQRVVPVLDQNDWSQ